MTRTSPPLMFALGMALRPAVALLLPALALLAPTPASAADSTAKSATSQGKPVRARAAPKKAAPAEEPPMQLNGAQLEVADRVLTGEAACEFNQSVSVLPVTSQRGHFRVSFKKAVYNMVPEETTTGAVRLVDRKAGMVWLQIPSKSMLMNSRIGQRMVDACMHSEQTAAVAAVEAAAQAASAAEAGAKK